MKMLHFYKFFVWIPAFRDCICKSASYGNKSLGYMEERYQVCKRTAMITFYAQNKENEVNVETQSQKVIADEINLMIRDPNVMLMNFQ